MLRRPPHARFFASALLVAALSLTVLAPRPAHATFHLIEITKIMAGYNGDASIQAVEMKMLAAFQGSTTGTSIKVYDAAGVAVATLGSFGGTLPNAQAGRKVLCATASFATTFGITPDLVIAAGIPATTGQVSFEAATCFVNAIPYGAITVFKNGTTAAAPLPTGGATVLVRVVDDATTPFCPLAEDANAKFRLASGSAGSPIAFTNNAGASVNVLTTVTGVEDLPPAVAAIRVTPNPIRGSARIEAPGWNPLTVHDLQGRMVRVLTCLWACPAMAGPFRGDWDGADDSGRRLASGVYFLRYVDAAGPRTKRVVLLH